MVWFGLFGLCWVLGKSDYGRKANKLVNE